jgi:hypothetical protein
LAYVACLRKMLIFQKLRSEYVDDSMKKLANEFFGPSGNLWMILLLWIWDKETKWQAKCLLGDWFQRVIRTDMAPVKKLARSLNEQIDNIMTYFTHWIANAMAEEINTKNNLIKLRARRYRNIKIQYSRAVLLRRNGSRPTIMPDGPLFAAACSDLNKNYYHSTQMGLNKDFKTTQ